MNESILAKDVREGMKLILGLVPYTVTYIELKNDKIQFYLSRFNIKSSLVAKLEDDMTVQRS